VAGSSLSTAADAIEELEETARLFLMLQGRNLSILGAGEVEELQRRFAK